MSCFVTAVGVILGRMPELPRDVHGRAAPGATVRWIVEQQWGVIARRQLLSCGVGRGQIASWIGRSLLLPVHPGVYAYGHGVLPSEGRMVAALLYAGKGSGLSNDTGMWWYGLVESEPSTVSVSAPGRRASLPGVDVHHPRTLELVTHRRFPITSLARTTLAYAATHSLAEVRRALSEADYRGLLDIDAIKAVCGRGHKGSAKLLSALERHEPRLAYSRSRLERKFIELCRRFGLPLPELNVRLGRMTVDAMFRANRVVVELDGYRAHHSPAQLARDRRRELQCRRLGFAVLRYTEDQIDNEPELVAADVARGLGLNPPAPLAG